MKLFDHKRRIRSNSIIGFLIMGLLVVSGCSSMIGTSSYEIEISSSEEEPEYIMPSSVFVNWDVVHSFGRGKPKVQGFGGKIIFEAEDHDGPIEVDGTITVYVFDDENFDSNNRKPLLKYIVTPEQLPSHYIQTKQNEHAYGFWIPWDDVGGPHRKVHLIIQFDGKQGEVFLRVDPKPHPKRRAFNPFQRLFSKRKP